MNRFLRDSVAAPPIVDFKKQLAARKPRTEHVFDMTQALPSFPTFEPIRKFLAHEIVHNAEMSFYTEVPGLLPLRQEIVARHPLGKSFDTQSVLVTAGANHAMYTALTTLVTAGDAVALIEPFYFNYDMAVKMMALKPVYLQARAEEGFALKADDVISQLGNQKGKQKVEALILITPNNPTGAIHSSAELLKLLAFTSQKKIHLIVDETYLIFDPDHLNDPRLGAFIESGDLSLVGSFSKSYSLTGYRVGYWITSRGNMEQALKVQDTLVICAPHMSQLAALHGLRTCHKELTERVQMTRQLAATLLQESKPLNRFKIRSAGAFFAYLEHPFENRSADEAAFWLYENAGISSLPGTVFGSRQSRFLRLAYCNLNYEQLTQAMRQLVEAEKSL